MNRLFRAGWVLPIAAPPIRHGWVATSDGRVTAVGGASSEPTPGPHVVDFGRAVILPGLVNAHTHLELSWMRAKVPPSRSMPAWASQLMSLRRTVMDEQVTPIVEAIRDARAAGTSLVGDITNTLAAYEPLAQSDIAAAVFLEVLGFNAPEPGRRVEDAKARLASLPPVERLRPTLAPHAPYSVSPDLFRAIDAAAAGGPLTVHLAESAEELQFLENGRGPWRELLARIGAWNDRWVPPGCSPVEYLDRLGLVSNRLIAVHCVRVTPADLRQLATAGATVVSCPRSNSWTGAGPPPVEDFYASGVRVAIGTDSLASVDDLSIFEELAELRRLAPAVPAARLLESATRHGAEALGFGGDFGTLEPGRLASAIAVQVPPGVEDVEEYLVGGIEPGAITWLDAS